MCTIRSVSNSPVASKQEQSGPSGDVVYFVFVVAVAVIFPSGASRAHPPLNSLVGLIPPESVDASEANWSSLSSIPRGIPHAVHLR